MIEYTNNKQQTIKMDATKFDAILASLTELDVKQVNTLFHKILDKKGVLIVCASYREDFDSTLEENHKNKLTDDEWEQFCDKMDPEVNCCVNDMMNMNIELRNGVMDEICPDWYDRDVTDDDSNI